MTNKILFIFYFITTLIFLIGVVLSFYDYSYLGYYADKIINWLWLGFTFIVIFRFWKRKSIKVYFFSLLALIFLSILPMAIPFFGIANYFSTIGDYQQIELNSTYRIERTRQSALSMPQIYVYEKIGILEKNICRLSYSQIVEEILNIERYEASIDIEMLPIQDARLIGFKSDSIGIEYQISQKKKIIYHKLKK